MAASKKVLALGLAASGGGDWPPLTAVVLGLSQRGHRVRYFADAPIATALRHTAIVVDAVRPEATLRSYMLRWNERAAAAGPSAAGYIPLVTPLTEWSADSLPTVCDLIAHFQPDVLLSQFFTTELASRIKAETGLPWGFVNPAYYFGPQSRRPLAEDIGPRDRPLFAHCQSLLEGADLVLHATDAVFDPPPRSSRIIISTWGPLLWEPPNVMPSLLAEPGPPWVLVTLSLSPQQEDMRLARAALTALAAQPVRVLLTLSERHPREELLPLPANTRVESYVPHAEVLPRACLLVSHAGHGVVLKALYYEVPMVLVPWGRDQPGVAARAEALGVAQVIPREALSDVRLSEAVAAVLRAPQYQSEAQRHAQRLQGQHPVDVACQAIEALLNVV
jgi:UDP:flavonoid glycosyltransferase YjiC (YdhE family)